MTARVTQTMATVLLVGLFSSDRADACTCARTGSPNSQVKQAFQSESQVFSARVLDIQYSDDGRQAFAEVEVLEVWKGSVTTGTLLKFSTMPRVGGMSCALSAEVGQELATYTSDALHVSSCTTHSLSGSWGDRERQLLDKLRRKYQKKVSGGSPNTSLERTRER